MREPDDSKILQALREAKESVEMEVGGNNVAQVLLYLQNRNRLLEHACRAAEVYLRSGHGEHEHAVLVKRLSDLHRSSRRTVL